MKPSTEALQVAFDWHTTRADHNRSQVLPENTPCSACVEIAHMIEAAVARVLARLTADDVVNAGADRLLASMMLAGDQDEQSRAIRDTRDAVRKVLVVVQEKLR